MRNNLLALAGGEKSDQALEKAEIKASERAENLGLEKLLRLSDALNEVLK